jgi:hypothetical protein
LSHPCGASIDNDPMTVPDVWVSTTTPEIVFDDDGRPGDHWQLVGTIDTMQESEFYKHIQVQLGHRNTAPRFAEFYLSGDPDNTWVQTAKNDAVQPFWVAIDPWGSMRPQIHGAHPTYYVSNQKAAVTSLAPQNSRGPSRQHDQADHDPDQTEAHRSRLPDQQHAGVSAGVDPRRHGGPVN